MKKPYSLLIEGDCLKVMSSIPRNSIDLILCDLPYGTTQNSWDSVIPFDDLWKQYKRIIKPNGAILLMSQGIFTAKVIMSQEKLFKYKITWVKSKATNFLNAKKQPLRKHEDICVFYGKQPKYSPQMAEGEAYNKGLRKKQLTGSYGDFSPSYVQSTGLRYPTDIIYFKTAESEGDVWHSTQKPVELGRYLIKTYAEEGDVILDNCFGSASFIVASAKENCHSIGIELNNNVVKFKNDYIDLFEVAEKRLAGIANVKSVDSNTHLENHIDFFFSNVKFFKQPQENSYHSELKQLPFDQLHPCSLVLA